MTDAARLYLAVTGRRYNGPAPQTYYPRVAKNGKDYDNTYLFLYRVTEGRIAEAWVEFDTAYAFDKFA